MGVTPASKTSPTRLRVLIADANPDDARLFTGQLELNGLGVAATVVDSEAAFMDALGSGVDVILFGSTPKFAARRALEILHQRGARVPLVLVTETLSDAEAVDYMRMGACDYVVKDELHGLATAVRDAVDRRRLEIDAADANTRLSQILESLGIAQVTSTGEGDAIESNDVAWRNLGFQTKAAYLAHRGVDNWADPDKRSKFIELLAEHGALHDYEVAFRRRDGSVLWTRGHYRATRDASGKITRIDSLIIDATPRKQAELELAVSRQRLDSALRNAPIALWTMDRELRITFAGGAALRPLKLDSVQVVGTSARELLKVRPDLIKLLERAIAGEELFVEDEIAGRYLHLKLTPLKNGDIDGVTAVALDVTARHAAEVRAEAKARQETAVRRLAQAALAEPALQALFDQAVKLVTETLDVEHASVFQFDPETDTARRVAWVGVAQPFDTVSTKTGIPASVVQRGQTRAIDQVLPDDHVDMPFLKAMGIQSLLVAPIRGETAVFGALAASTDTQRRWTNDERDFIQLVADTLWTSLERSAHARGGDLRV